MAAADRSPIAMAILDGADGMASIRDDWDALYRQAGQELSLSYAWTHAVASLYAAPTDRVRTITLRQDGRLVGVLPLIARTTRRWYTHLTPLAEEHNTHSDWLIAEPSRAVAEAFVEGVITCGAHWDRFRMSRVLEDNPLLPHVVAALRRRGLRFLQRVEPPSYVLRLPSTYPAYLAARSAKFRNHLKRVEKKIHALHPHVTVLAGDQSESGFAEAFARILAIEQASWKHAHGWAMSSENAATEFWRRVCASAWADGRIHVQFLALDGRPAAYNLGYVVGPDYAYLKTTFNSEFRAVGAAAFLRARLVEDLIQRGVQRMDFPGEPYAWERQWTAEVRGHVMLTAYAGTARSIALELLERARHARHTVPHPPASDPAGEASP